MHIDSKKYLYKQSYIIYPDWTTAAQDAQGAGASVYGLREEVARRCCWLRHPA
jgi:hypothetical protein